MAPSGRSDDQGSSDKCCRSCLKTTKSEIKCIICKAAFHGSCAVRITGIKVVGYNELLCPECVGRHDQRDDEASVANEKRCCEQTLRTNETLNMVVLKLMADRDHFSDEIQEIKEALRELLLTSKQVSISRQEHPKKNEKTSISSIDQLDPSTSKMSIDERIGTAASIASTKQLTLDETAAARRQPAGRRHAGDQTRNQNQNRIRPRDENGGVSISTAARHDAPHGSKSSISGSNLVDPKLVYSAIHEETTKMKAREIINLGDGEWRVVNGRRKRGVAGSGFIGTSKQPNIKLKSVPTIVSVYVTRLSPETKVEEVEAQLALQFPEAKAEEMPSKHPEIYKSFKVTVNKSNQSAIMSPEIWPAGIRVDKFFLRKSRTERTT